MPGEDLIVALISVGLFLVFVGFTTIFVVSAVKAMKEMNSGQTYHAILEGYRIRKAKTEIEKRGHKLEDLMEEYKEYYRKYVKEFEKTTGSIEAIDKEIADEFNEEKKYAKNNRN